jgi:hypothetical protein
MIHKVKLLFPILILFTCTIFLMLFSACTDKKNLPDVFTSPEEAVSRLIDALRAEDAPRVYAVVGSGSDEWLPSGDPVADRADWLVFLAAYEKKHVLRRESETLVLLTVGDKGWVFPAPLVMQDGKWRFDTEAGREEVYNRRVGRNELGTMETLLAIVDAQREYAAADPDRNGLTDYAPRFLSSTGKRDGLYWPTSADEPLSPLGSLVAAASRVGYSKEIGQEAQPFRGYYFRMLTAQGEAAPGGAYDYLVDDKLLGGFAVVAYPAKYGVSGVMTFIVNHEGVVYEQDLGAETQVTARELVKFNPDPNWRKAL